MVNLSDLNPLGSFNIGLGTIGNALLLIFIAFVIVGLTVGIVWWKIEQKKYKYIIPLYKTFNENSVQIGVYRAKAIPISLSGDTLWYVRGVNKYIAPAVLFDAPNRFPHEEREDGEWINFAISSVNTAQKKAGVKFIHQDMRSQKVATGQLLESRLLNKSFWDKYKDMIVQIIFYFVTVMFMVIIFWQWGGIVEKTQALIQGVNNIATQINGLECIEDKDSGLIPATAPAFILPFMFLRRKKWLS